MSAAPDYASLLTLLPSLRVFPDALGWTTLMAEEAAKIRSLGFSADAGPWKVPAVPPRLTRDTPFESLSAGWNDRPSWRATPGSEDRQKTKTISEQYGEAPSAPHRSVKAGDVRPEHYKAGRPAPSREDLDPNRIEEAATKVVEAIKREGGEINRRRLQQKLWRYRAPIFNQALRLLARCSQQITLDSKS
jgi:hypothetical protein